MKVSLWALTPLFVVIFGIFIIFILMHPPKPAAGINRSDMLQTIQILRSSNSRAPFVESGVLQNVTDDAIAQINNGKETVHANLNTQNGAVFSGHKQLAFIGSASSTPLDALDAWKKDGDSLSALLDPYNNVIGLSTGQDSDGLQYVYIVVARCDYSC